MRVRALGWGLLVLALLYLFLGSDPLGLELAERAESGERLRPRDYAAAYGWWTSAANAVALLVLLGSWRHWARTGEPAQDPELAPCPARATGFFKLGVGLAMVVLAANAMPRLDHALWTDEKYMVMRSIAGGYEVEEDGSLEFKAVSWGDTFFYYRKPNNHVPYSITARLCWDLWRSVTRPEDLRADERVVRAPALLGGLVGLATLGWLLLRLGLPGAGVLAAWLLALHPWYLRYASEVRGYALMMALLPVAILTALRVLERGSWGRWACYGACQALLLWSYPGTITVLVALNLLVLVRLLRGPSRAAPGEPLLLRFLVTNVISGLVWLQLNLANMMQFVEYAKHWRGAVSLRFLRETGLLLLFGTQSDTPTEGFVTMDSVHSLFPVLVPSLVAASIVALAAGAWRLWRAGPPGRLALGVLLLPAPMTIAFAALRGDHLYEWYLIHALPGAIGLIAAGLLALASLTSEGWPRRIALALVVGSFSLGYTVVTQPMRHAQTNVDMQPTFAMLRSFGWSRTGEPAADRPFLNAAVYGPNSYYDPFVRYAPKPEDLFALMKEADGTGQTLYVSYNRPALARRRSPEAIELLGRADLFEPLTPFDGVFPKYRRSVYRYRPGSLADPMAGAASP
ncbi:MAG: hypothetical protein CL910_05765 [Deltaproteobacteria bacterium]|nr:hypothetical protein [Deltaproteobacteria bacterium]